MQGTKMQGIPLPTREERGYPLTDAEAWEMYGAICPWVFDRLSIARNQGLRAAPHGVTPPRGPIYSQPIINLAGGGAGARKIEDWRDEHYQPGHFWMPAFQGDHRSVDVVMVKGQAVWRYVVNHEKDANGVYWAERGHPSLAMDEKAEGWVQANLPDYTGIAKVNIISIPGYESGMAPAEVVMSVNLRPNVDFLDFQGPGFLEALEVLYREGRWEHAQAAVPAAVISVRAARENGHTFTVDPNIVKELRSAYVWMGFEHGQSQEHVPNDPWTYRLAMVGDASEEVAVADACKLAPAIQVLAGEQSVERMS